MTSFLVTLLFLLTVVASFAFGIAAAYWVIREFLNLFDPARTNKPAPVRDLAPTTVGD